MAADTVSDRSPLELCRLACEELRQRLRSGQPCQAETFLSAHPPLSTNPELAVELIVAEFQVRRELGEDPNPLEWLDRFPQYRDLLASAFESHRLLSVTPSAGVSTGAKTAAYADTWDAIDLDGPVPALEQHEKHEELGRGAMGVVYRARDKVLNRVVALKTIQSGLLAGPVEVRRFYREAQAAARLHHPNIVPIYHMGLFEGQHSYTMRLVKGGTLAQQLRKYKDDCRSAAALMEKVARGVHAAHVAGIIHRDLKPANIMLDETGEPLVADFGLARIADAPADMSLPGQLFGTPAYMSPEQAAGHNSKVSPRSDVWSLGVILYEMLAGRRPFNGNGREEVREEVQTAEPPPLRQLKPEVPRELATMVMKCLEKKPESRYQTAEALAEDLGRWLRGEKPAHTRPTALGRFALHVGNKAVWLLAALLVLSAAVLLALLRPLGPPSNDALSTIRQQIIAGKEVALLDQNGRPFVVKWLDGEGLFADLKEEKGTLTFHTLGLARLELLPDMPVDRFRFRARVQHNEPELGGHTGIYCHYQNMVSEDKPDPFSCDFWFRYQNGNVPQLTAFESRRWRDRATRGPLPVRLPPRPDGWNELELRVTPQRTQAFLNAQPIAVFTRTHLEEYARDLIGPGPALGPHPDFPPRGGIGLFVHRGGGSFRDVRIEPLSDEADGEGD